MATTEDPCSALDTMLSESPSFSSPAQAETWLRRLDSLIQSVEGLQSPPEEPDKAATVVGQLVTAKNFANSARHQLLAYVKRTSAKHREHKVSPGVIAADLKSQSTGLTRESSASERSKRLTIERSTRTLEIETAKVESELQAAQAEIMQLKAKVNTLALGGGLESVSSDLEPLPSTLSEDWKATLLNSLSNVPMGATDSIAAIVKDYSDGEEVDLSELPVDALVRIKETIDALTKLNTDARGAAASKPSTREIPSSAATAQHQRAAPSIPSLGSSTASVTTSPRRRRRQSTGVSRPNLAAAGAAPQQAPALSTKPSRRARPQDLSRNRSTRGNATKIRATSVPKFAQASEPVCPETQSMTNSSNETMSRTSTFADLIDELGEENTAPEEAPTRPVTFSFVGAQTLCPTSTVQMADSDLSRTRTLEMSSLDVAEDAAFLAEVQHIVSILAASGADTKLAAGATLKLAKLVLDSQGQIVVTKQNAVAEASGGLLVQALRVYAAVPLMQVSALTSLLHLCKDNVAVCEAIHGAGGVELLFATMAAYVAEARIQQKALALSSQLAQHGGSATHTALVGANVVEAIATVMREHNQDGSVFLYGCITLNALLCAPTVAQYVATQVWSFGIVQSVQAVLPLHVSKKGFEKLRINAEKLATLMAQAAAQRGLQL